MRAARLVRATVAITLGCSSDHVLPWGNGCSPDAAITVPVLEPSYRTNSIRSNPSRLEASSTTAVKTCSGAAPAATRVATRPRAACSSPTPWPPARASRLGAAVPRNPGTPAGAPSARRAMGPARRVAPQRSLFFRQQAEAVAGLTVRNCRSDELHEAGDAVSGVGRQELGRRRTDAEEPPEIALDEHGDTDRRP